jgi:hypothetical protein
MTVRGGAFCHLWDSGVTVKGTQMTCAPARDGRARWRRADGPLPTATQISATLATSPPTSSPEAPVKPEPTSSPPSTGATHLPKTDNLIETGEPTFNTPEYWRQVAERARRDAAAAMKEGRVERSQRAQLRAEEADGRANHMGPYRAKAFPVAGPPVSGDRDRTKPLDENGWGYKPFNPTAYHPDGPIGCAVHAMGDDKYMLMDGQPLANVLGRTATDVVVGRRTPAEGLAAYKVILGRLPTGSVAHRELADAVRKMDGTGTPASVELPAEVPEPLHRLMRQLHTVPVCRADPREIPALKELADAWMTGDRRAWRLETELHNTVYNRRHESQGDCGKLQIDEMVAQAVTDWGTLSREQRTPPPLRNR